MVHQSEEALQPVIRHELANLPRHEAVLHHLEWVISALSCELSSLPASAQYWSHVVHMEVRDNLATGHQRWQDGMRPNLT